MVMQEHTGKTCPYCQYTIKPDVSIDVCSGDCKMPHHKECWDENGGCTTFGCSAGPAMSGASHALIQPVSPITIEEASVQQGDIVSSISQNKASSNNNIIWFIGISVVIFLFVFFAAVNEESERTNDHMQSNNSAENLSDNFNDAAGIGSINWDNGTYAGQLKNGDMPHGEGEWSNLKGEKYVGEWKDGKKHGYGTYIWADGREYTGDWLSDYRNGQGHWINPSKGYEYEGGWKNGHFHGEGTFIINTSQGQEIYEGEYRNNEKHGYGKWTFPDGAIYAGKHRDGMKHGEGEFIHADGTKVTGEWAYGEYIIEQETQTSFSSSNTTDGSTSSQPVQNHMVWGTIHNYSSETYDYYINGFYVARLKPSEQYQLSVPIGYTYFAAYDIYGFYGTYYEMYLDADGWYIWVSD